MRPGGPAFRDPLFTPIQPLQGEEGASRASMPRPPGRKKSQGAEGLGRAPVRLQRRKRLQATVDSLQIWDGQFHGRLLEERQFFYGSIHAINLKVGSGQRQDHRRRPHARAQVSYPGPGRQSVKKGKECRGVQQKFLPPLFRGQRGQGMGTIPPI